jgi:hypothetical protein
MMSHRSFGGDGVCIFVKINPNKFLESFNELAQYYWDNFNLAIDPSCKNKNRLRFISYDPYLFLNENSKKFVAKQVVKKEKVHNFVFVNCYLFLIFSNSSFNCSNSVVVKLATILFS